MTESGWSITKPHTVEANVARLSHEQMLRTKAYIDERARRGWREKYGEVHEEYVTVQTQVFLDDAGDVTVVMPRYHPPGVASSSMYSGVTPPTSIPKPGLPPADHFHCNLAQSIRDEALGRANDVERDFDTQLWLLWDNAVAKGSDPERRKLGYTPASLYGCPRKTYLVARDVFKDRVKSMWDPQHFKYGIWGFENVEVDIVRGIIFVRYITGWWERDKKELAEKRLKEKRPESRRVQHHPGRDANSIHNVDMIHDDLDA